MREKNGLATGFDDDIFAVTIDVSREQFKVQQHCMFWPKKKKDDETINEGPVDAPNWITRPKSATLDPHRITFSGPRRCQPPQKTDKNVGDSRRRRPAGSEKIDDDDDAERNGYERKRNL